MKIHKLNKESAAIFHTITAGLQPGEAREIDTNGENSGIMSVHVERLSDVQPFEKSSILKQFSVAHYYEQHGDLMRDPEMCFYVNHHGEVWPAYFRQDGWPGYEMESLYFRDGRIFQARSAQYDAKNFGNQWMLNIADQQELPEFKPVTA